MTEPTVAATAQTPLTCIMPIKSAEDADKLAALLVHAKPKVDAALTDLSTVHFARFVFLQNRTQLAIITEYDGDFEGYISDFAIHIGEVFDALFKHIENPPPAPVAQNRDAFIEWVRERDVPHSGFFSAYPKSKVVDILAAVDA